MAQWIDVFRNNSFVNLTQLPVLCRNSRAITLVQLGLTVGWLAGWLVGWQAGRLAGWPIDEMWVSFKFLKCISYRSNFYTFCCV